MNYITKQEVMERMNWSRHHFETMRKKGMPVYNLGHKRYVKSEEFQEWMLNYKESGEDFTLKVWS